MGLRFFKRRNEVAIRCQCQDEIGFNGAALFQAQKYIAVSLDLPYEFIWLQWGCAFSSAEITYRSQGH